MNLAHILRKNVYLATALFVLTATPALADLSWDYSSGGESFSLITTGNPSDLAGHPPGSVTFTALDFKVHTSTLFSGFNGYSVSGGQLQFGAIWGLGVTWNGDPAQSGFGCGGRNGCWIGIYLPGTSTGYQLYEGFGGITNRAFLVQNNSPLMSFNTSITPGTPAPAVPEPASMMLLGSGLAAVLVLSRRRRSRRLDQK